MEGSIIFEKEGSEGKICIRYPKENDVDIICDYINILSQERTYLRFQGEKITLEEETKYLTDQLDKIKKRKAILLLILLNEKLIGISGIEMRDRVEKHIGELGISLLLGYRERGLGSLLMEKTLNEARSHLPELKIVMLGVFSCNEKAKSLYKKFGFTEYGLLPKGIKYKEELIDHLYMYKNI